MPSVGHRETLCSHKSPLTIKSVFLELVKFNPRVTHSQTKVPFVPWGAIIFTGYYTASLIALLFIISQTKHRFHLSQWYHLFVLCCIICSILNGFFYPQPEPHDYRVRLNYKNRFFAKSAYLTENTNQIPVAVIETTV
jgi:hypothetical protein